VLPILHLNGYKSSNPTVLARIEREELEQFFRGCGWTPYFVQGAQWLTMEEAVGIARKESVSGNGPATTRTQSRTW